MSEVIDTFERDGWSITVALEPDYDYQPGQDDDIYPRMEDPGYYFNREEVEEAGGFVVDFRHGAMMVTGEEVARLVEIGWGKEISAADQAKARESIKADAQAIGHENLSWVGVVVTASRGTISGSDSLWGIEYDLRESDPEKYPRECVEEHGMVTTAIERAARQALGGLATQALGY